MKPQTTVTVYVKIYVFTGIPLAEKEVIIKDEFKGHQQRRYIFGPKCLQTTYSLVTLKLYF